MKEVVFPMSLENESNTQKVKSKSVLLAGIQ
jgi:hypothetical protein